MLELAQICKAWDLEHGTEHGPCQSYTEHTRYTSQVAKGKWNNDAKEAQLAKKNSENSDSDGVQIVDKVETKASSSSK